MRLNLLKIGYAQRHGLGLVRLGYDEICELKLKTLPIKKIIYSSPVGRNELEFIIYWDRTSFSPNAAVIS